MAAVDLTTLANVKTWLNITTSGSDAELGRYITAASRFVLNYLGRPNLQLHTVNERRNGNGSGNGRIMLREYPVLSVSSLIVSQCVIPAQPIGQTLQAGFFVDAWDGQDASGPQSLNVLGYGIYRGLGNVEVVYTAGFQTTDSDTVPASPYQVATQRPWAADGGVTYSDGTALVAVPSAPSTGQYSVTSGVYTFAVGDLGAGVDITYSYTPEDLSNGVMELVGERLRLKDRIGQMSKSLGGQETVSFSQKDLNDMAHRYIDQFRLVAPIGR